MNTERLLRLAEHIESLPAEQFDMETWGQQSECGTVCCAFGHACSVPEFRAAGLELLWKDESDGTRSAVPFFCGLAGFYAAREFFGISRQQAEYLFCDADYEDDAPTAPVVAARIRELAKGGAS